MAISIFGPRILGKKKFDEQQVAAKKGANIYGPKVLGTKGLGSVRRTRRIEPDFEEEDRELGPVDLAPNGAREDSSLESDDPQQTADDTESEAEVGTSESEEADAVTRGMVETQNDVDASGDGYLSEVEVKDAIDRQPELFQRLLELELGRGKGPRKGVSRLLLAFEQEKREGGPRASIVRKLNSAING